jgi:hypothetical protein
VPAARNDRRSQVDAAILFLLVDERLDDLHRPLVAL